MEKLKPCPFCNGKQLILADAPHDAIDKDYWIQCRSCACNGPWMKNSEGAKRMWNMRAGYVRLEEEHQLMEEK